MPSAAAEQRVVARGVLSVGESVQSESSAKYRSPSGDCQVMHLQRSICSSTAARVVSRVGNDDHRAQIRRHAVAKLETAAASLAERARRGAVHQRDGRIQRPGSGRGARAVTICAPMDAQAPAAISGSASAPAATMRSRRRSRRSPPSARNRSASSKRGSRYPMVLSKARRPLAIR